LGNFKRTCYIIGLEIFNLFNNQNAITNTCLRCLFQKWICSKLYDDTCLMLLSQVVKIISNY
jgi:hypothetical protein